MEYDKEILSWVFCDQNVKRPIIFLGTCANQSELITEGIYCGVKLRSIIQTLRLIFKKLSPNLSINQLTYIDIKTLRILLFNIFLHHFLLNYL